MLLFKYFPATPLALSMLRRGEIFFALPDEQNDPSECRCDYVIDGPIESWVRLIHSTFYYCLSHCNLVHYLEPELVDEVFSAQKAIATMMRKSVRGKAMRYEDVYPSFANAISAYLSDKLSEKQVSILCQMVKWVICEKYNAKLSDDKAVVSFSKSATNPTMWSHYAENQKGFCLIYDAPNLELSVKAQANILDGFREVDFRGIGMITELGHYQEETLKISPVIYKKSPPKVNAFRYLANQFKYSEREDRYDVPESIRDSGRSFQESEIGLVKSTDWKYEKEMRAFFPQFKKLPSSARCLEVKKNTIKGVILGPNCAPETTKKIVTALYLYQGEIPPGDKICVFQAKSQTGTFSLDINLLGIVGGHGLYGDMPWIIKAQLDNKDLQYGESLSKLIIGSRR